MKYVSLFAGIGGFDLALNRLGHECVYANEWDKYAAQTYEKNFKHKPDTRDITLVKADEVPDHDCLVGGFPCQAFSVAGKRMGFEETRGTLFFDICRILRAKRTPLVLLENVKGLLSHDSGKTFHTIITSLDELGYDLQWQVLNSKNFGVPQNRERVFIVGHLRGTPRPKVFPLTKSSEGDLKYSGGVISARQKWKEDGKNFSRNFSQGQRIYSADGISQILAGNAGGQGGKTGLYEVLTHYGHKNKKAIRMDMSPTLKAQSHGHEPMVVKRQPLKFLQRNQKNIEGDYAFTVDGANTGGVLINRGKLRRKNDVSNTVDANYWKELDNHGARTGIISKTIRSGGRKSPHGSKQNWDSYEFESKIRRLTPLECERLQGFPDNWTNVTKSSIMEICVDIHPAIAKLLPKLGTVFCTTSVGKDTERQICSLEKNLPVTFAVDGLLPESSVTDIIKAGNVMATHYNPKEISQTDTKTQQNHIDDKTGEKSTYKLWKLILAENLPKEKLSTILTSINEIMTSPIFTSVNQEQNIIGYIILSSSQVRSYTLGRKYSLTVTNTKSLMSDTQRYKQLGNAVTVNVAYEIAKRL